MLMRALKFVAGLAWLSLLGACGARVAGADDKGGVAEKVERVASKAGGEASRSFVATGFTGVKLAGSDDVVVTRGDKFSVVATGPQDVLDKLDIAVKNGVLVIGRAGGMMHRYTDDGARVAVTLPRLDRAELTGSGTLSIDQAEADAVNLVLSGSGDLAVDAVTAKAMAIAMAGSGDLTVKAGKADRGEVSLAGSGDVDVNGVTLGTANISLSGSGDVDATATATASVAIVGSGDVRLGGGAKCDTSEMGSGTVSCR